MEAEIPASNLKLFQRALTFLHKVGQRVITLETSHERLTLRALSAAESAYAQIAFAPAFFTRYSHSATAAQVDAEPRRSSSPSFDDDDGGRQGGRGWAPMARSPSPTSSLPSAALPRYYTVQIHSRMLLVPFRGSMSAVKRVTLRLCPADELGYGEMEGKGGGGVMLDALPARRRRKGADVHVELNKDLCLMVQLHLEEHAVVRTYRLPTLEQPHVLQPNFSRQACSTHIGAKASKFLIWLQNFPEVEELSLTCGRPTVRFRSFLDWAAQNDSVSLDAQVTAALAGTTPTRHSAKAVRIRAFVQTESVVSSDDFALYELSDACAEQAMVFTLPEVRLFASMCEESDEELFLFAIAPGQPLLLTNTRTPLLTAQQRQTKQARQAEREQQQQQQPQGAGGDGGGGTEEFVASTLAPSPMSVGESQYSFNTAVAEEQRQRTWSGELILATLAPEVAMMPSQDSSQSQPARQPQARTAERRPSPSPSPAPPTTVPTGAADGGGRTSPALSPSFEV